MAATLEQRRKQRFEFLRCLYEMSRGSERVLFYVHEIADVIGLGQMEAEIAAQYLYEKRLIRVLMRPIISISQAGIDELEAALEFPQQTTAHFPAAEGIAWEPVIAQPPTPRGATGKQPPDEAQETELPPRPLEEARLKPLPAHLVQNDSNELAALELQRICEALGLDPREFGEELGPRPECSAQDPVTSPEQTLEAARSSYAKHEPPDFNDIVDSSSPQPRPDNRRFSFNEADLDVILESVRQQLPRLEFPPDQLAEAQAEIDTARAQLASPKPKPHILAASLRTLSSILENAGPPLSSDTWENLVAIRDFNQRLSRQAG